MKKSNKILLTLVLTSVLTAPIFAQSTKPTPDAGGMQKLKDAKKGKAASTQDTVRNGRRSGISTIRGGGAVVVPPRVVTAPRTTTPTPSVTPTTTPSTSRSAPHVTTGGFGGTSHSSGSHASS